MIRDDQSNVLCKDDIESLKLEMVRELRDMKQNLKDANVSNTDLLRELKDMNAQLIR